MAIIKLKSIIEENLLSNTDKIYNKSEMIKMGADGYLSGATLKLIPIDKINRRELIPSESENEPYIKNKKIKVPIEVEYQPENDVYILYSGNHRVHQAEINEDKEILAFVENI